MRRLAPVLALIIHREPAVACTVCHSEVGKEIRAGIFGPDFAFNLMVTVLPFIVFLAITALIYFGVPGRRRSNPSDMQGGLGLSIRTHRRGDG